MPTALCGLLVMAAGPLARGDVSHSPTTAAAPSVEMLRAVANGSVQLHTSPARGLLIINDYSDGETQEPERQRRLACTPEQIAGELSWVVGDDIPRALEASQSPRAATNDILKLWCKPTGAGTTCGGFVQVDDGGAARVELIFLPGSDGKPVLDAVISLDKIRTRYAERQLRRPRSCPSK